MERKVRILKLKCPVPEDLDSAMRAIQLEHVECEMEVGADDARALVRAWLLDDLELWQDILADPDSIEDKEYNLKMIDAIELVLSQLPEE